MSTINFISPIIHFEDWLFTKVAADKMDILNKKGTTIDLWGVALDPKYMGKKLAFKLMELSHELGKLQGYSHAFCYATNFKTTKALLKTDYEMIATDDVWNFT